MKNSLFILLLSALFLAPSTGNAQNCEIYEDYREGSTIKSVYYDQKDKPTGYTITTVKEKKKDADGVLIQFQQNYSNYDDYSFESEFSIRCNNGEVTVDMQRFIDPSSMTAYEGMDFEVSADDLSIPENASVGDELNGGTVTVSVNTGTPVKVTVAVTLSNRVVAGKETVVTPAGTFECLKITYDILSQIGFVKIRSSAAEYYSKRDGVIKSETFNKKGKITGYTIVEEINN